MPRFENRTAVDSPISRRKAAPTVFGAIRKWLESVFIGEICVRCFWLAAAAFDAGVAQGVGEALQHVVQPVADVADAEAGALADLLVLQVVVIF